jgi:hypothetical protein
VPAWIIVFFSFVSSAKFVIENANKKTNKINRIFLIPKERPSLTSKRAHVKYEA